MTSATRPFTESRHLEALIGALNIDKSHPLGDASGLNIMREDGRKSAESMSSETQNLTARVLQYFDAVNYFDELIWIYKEDHEKGPDALYLIMCGEDTHEKGSDTLDLIMCGEDSPVYARLLDDLESGKRKLAGCRKDEIVERTIAEVVIGAMIHYAVKYVDSGKKHLRSALNTYGDSLPGNWDNWSILRMKVATGIYSMAEIEQYFNEFRLTDETVERGLCRIEQGLLEQRQNRYNQAQELKAHVSVT